MERSSPFSLVVICGVNVGDFVLCRDDHFPAVPCRVRADPMVNVVFPEGRADQKSPLGRGRDWQESWVLSLDVQGFCLFLGLSSVSVDFKEFARMSGAVCFYSVELVFLSAETLQWHLNFSISWEALSFDLGDVQPEIATQLGKDGWEGGWEKQPGGSVGGAAAQVSSVQVL